MNLTHVMPSLALALLVAAAPTHGAPTLDDPNTVVTVMQFSARDAASKAELVKRMAEMRDYIRKQPGYIENALMENRNGDQKPHYVGVSRWNSFKDWEAMWLKPDFQKLVRSVGEVGDVNPGTFAPIKR